MLAKKVFTLPTTHHMNSAPYQDGEVHRWLTAIMEQYAKQTTDGGNTNGRPVTIIVEVLEA